MRLTTLHDHTITLLGPAATPMPLDEGTRASLLARVAAFLKANAGPGALVPALDSGELGLRALWLEGEAARQLLTLAQCAPSEAGIVVVRGTAEDDTLLLVHADPSLSSGRVLARLSPERVLGDSSEEALSAALGHPSRFGAARYRDVRPHPFAAGLLAAGHVLDLGLAVAYLDDLTDEQVLSLLRRRFPGLDVQGLLAHARLSLAAEMPPGVVLRSATPTRLFTSPVQVGAYTLELEAKTQSRAAYYHVLRYSIVRDRFYRAQPAPRVV